MPDLTQRIESASAEEQRGLLEEAAIKLMGGSQASIDPRWQRWDKLLDAEAYVDAALMLVPEGCSVTVDTRNPPAALCQVDRPDWTGDKWSYCATLGLAIAAASLCAGGAQ